LTVFSSGYHQIFVPVLPSYLECDDILVFAVLLQTASGTVEAKVTCFYRRRDLSSALIALADKHHSK